MVLEGLGLFPDEVWGYLKLDSSGSVVSQPSGRTKSLTKKKKIVILSMRIVGRTVWIYSVDAHDII